MTTTTRSADRTTRRRSSATPTPDIALTTSALKASVLKEHLKRGLAKAQHAIAGGSLPVLSHVLLVAETANQLKISATNLEIGIVVTIAAKVSQVGAITLPAKLLFDVVSGLPNDAISLEMDARTQSVRLTCGAFETNIKGFEAAEFPIIPSSAGGTSMASLAPEALCSAISQVAFAAAADETRPILTGVRIRLAQQRVSFAAADTFRIAFRDITLDTAVASNQEVVVPARAMTTLGKVLADVDGGVELVLDDHGDRAIFHTDEIELVTRCIDGAYPAVDKYLTLTCTSVTEIDTKALARAVKLASFFASASANVVRLQFTPLPDGAGTLTISANAAEVGNNTSAQQTIVLKGVGDETYTHVAMPMAVK